MGLLSDPSLTRTNKLGRNLAKHSRKICFLFYIAGLAWFVCLGHQNFNHGTYLSENALSPGLVYPEVQQDSVRLAQNMLDELRREQIDHKTTTPHAWIAAKMHQMGLETHVHNFTLHYPYSGGQKTYEGKNIYGILRAQRSASTEGVVFTAPYRAPNSIHTDITPSVPVLLAFAQFARRKNYWAKDLVFLVTEQEQLGMQAFLSAYYTGDKSDSFVLNSGNLPARAGALQAAINLEVQDLDFDYIDVKIEGLNGQLPNLDLFNLIQRITSREGISSGYKHSPTKKRRYSHTSVEENLKHMISMMSSQAMGVPNGNHGLFHRYRVESLTLEAVRRTTHSSKGGNMAGTVLALLKTIEGISRSLNNLLERFHQSYFFYILVQNDRFVSIGDFIPCLILMAGPLFIKAFFLWLCASSNAKDEENNAEMPMTATQTATAPYGSVLIYMVLVFGLCIFGQNAPTLQVVRNLASQPTNLSAATLIGGSILILSVSMLLLAACTRLPEGGLLLLHVLSLIFMGVALLVIGLLNFGFGFMAAMVVTPMALLISTERGISSSCKLFTLSYTLLLNPLLVAVLTVLGFTLFQFPELALSELLKRATTASMDAMTFALMDNMIYGNWLYTAFTCVFMPLWTLFFTLALSKQHAATAAAVVKQKVN